MFWRSEKHIPALSRKVADKLCVSLGTLWCLSFDKDHVPVRMRERERTALCFTFRPEPSNETLKYLMMILNFCL